MEGNSKKRLGSNEISDSDTDHQPSPKTPRISLELFLANHRNVFTKNKYNYEEVFCESCRTMIGCSVSTMRKHLDSKKHKKQIDMNKRSEPTQDEYIDEMAKVFSAVDIINKVDNKILADFLEKYTKRPTPSYTTLRRREENIQAELQNKIRAALVDKYIWIAFDETTDKRQRNLMNLMAGALDSDEKTNSYLLGSVFLDRTKK